VLVSWRGSFVVLGLVSLVWALGLVLVFTAMTRADHASITRPELERPPARRPDRRNARSRPLAIPGVANGYR